jgi:hypothetical protein
MGQDKAGETNIRADNEPSSTQQDCCGTTRSLGKGEAAAEGGVTVVPSEQKERERDFVPLSGVLSR